MSGGRPLSVQGASKRLVTRLRSRVRPWASSRYYHVFQLSLCTIPLFVSALAVSSAVASADRSTLIPSTLEVCLSPSGSFNDFSEQLADMGWSYPVTPDQTSAYWSGTFGAPMAPKMVVHSDTGFPGVNLDGAKPAILFASFQKIIPEGFVMCSLRLGNEIDFLAGRTWLEHSGELDVELSNPPTINFFGFGAASAGTAVDEDNKVTPFAIDTTASLFEENTE